MDTPIACTLAPVELERRLAELGALARDALLGRRPIAGGERLTFAPGDATERRLRAAVAAEAACCRFLALDLRVEPDRLVLDVTGPEEVRPLVRELFA